MIFIYKEQNPGICSFDYIFSVFFLDYFLLFYNLFIFYKFLFSSLFFSPSTRFFCVVSIFCSIIKSLKF